MAALVLAVVFVGFGRSFFYAPFMAVRPIRPLLKVHAVVFSLWVLLFILQVAFVSLRRTDLHRRMGIIGALIATLLVIIGTLTIFESVRLQSLRAGAINLFGSGAQLLLFAVLVSAGLWQRHRPDLHKRLILVATLALAQAGLGRILPGLLRCWAQPRCFRSTWWVFRTSRTASPGWRLLHGCRASDSRTAAGRR